MTRARLHEIVLWVALVAACGAMFVLVSPEPASGQSTACPADPGPVAGTITNDAAIEVHALRREQAAACVALAVASENVDASVLWVASLIQVPLQDSLDLAWWGAWAVVGVLLGVFAGTGLQQAFKFWQGDNP